MPYFNSTIYEPLHILHAWPGISSLATIMCQKLYVYIERRTQHSKSITAASADHPGTVYVHIYT